MVVFGAGSGRCGTASLSVLLGNCRNSYVTHETIPHLHWDDVKYEFFKRRLRKFDDSDYKIRGDIASVYLPYLDKLADEETDCDWKGVILKRDKRETVESFMRITGPRNNWQKKGPYNPMFWMFFPKYPDKWSKVEALKEYWEDYYELADRVANKTERVKIFPTDALNSKKGQKSIFRHLGIRGKITLPCKHNVST